MATYYVNATDGDDEKDGQSEANAWKTISKVNSSSFNAGDSILFKRGEVWREQLTVPSSGSSGSPIIFGAYGSGADPIINGADVFTGWEEYGSGKEENHVYKDDANLQALWLMEEESGTRYDYTANNNDLTDNNTVTRTATHKEGSYAAEFVKANSEYLSQSYGGVTYDNKANWSMVAWVYLSDLDNHQTIFDFCDGYDGIDLIYTTSTDKFRVTRSGDGTNRITDQDFNTQISSTGWYHVGITFDGATGNYEFYLNGSDDGGVASTSVTKIYNDGGEDFYIGYSDDHGIYSDIYIDEFAIFDRTLSATEISNIYTSGIEDIPASNTYQKTGVTTEPYMVWMDGTLLTKGSDKDNLNDHEWIWEANVLYLRDDSGDPDVTGVTIEASQRDRCIYSDGKSYITVDGLSAKYTQQQGIYFDEDGTQGQHIIIENCTINNTGYEGIRTENNDTKIDSCTVSYTNLRGGTNYGGAITIKSGWGTSTAEVAACNISYAKGATGQGINVSNSADGVHIHHNTIHHCQDEGIKLYDGSCNCIIEYNTVHTNGLEGDGGNHGIAIYSTSTATTGNYIRYNLIYNNYEAGLEFIQLDVNNGDISGNYVYYNIFYGNGIGLASGEIKITECDGTNYFYNNVCAKGDGYGIFINNNSANQVFKNNILYSNTSEDLYLASGATTGHTFDYNCYYRSSGNIISYGGDTYTVATFSTYQSEKSQDANGIASDPLFVDAANDNFHLQITSPCINAGTSVGLTEDYEGNPVGALPDIGAYEKIMGAGGSLKMDMGLHMT